MSRFAGTHLAVRIAVATVGAAAIMLASGCGVGQVAETANIQSAVPGASGVSTVPQDPSVNSGNGQILVQNVTIDYIDPAGYLRGGKAALNMRIINNSASDVELVGATTPVGTIVLSGRDVAPPPQPAATASSPSANPSANPSASPSQAPAPQPAPAPAAVKIPAGQIVDLSVGAGKFLQITGLSQDLVPGDTTSLTFSFANTTYPSGTINDIVLNGVPLAPPAVAGSRSAVPNEGTEGN